MSYSNITNLLSNFQLYRYWFVATCCFKIYFPRWENLSTKHTWTQQTVKLGQAIPANLLIFFLFSSVPRIFLFVLMCTDSVKQLSAYIYTRFKAPAMAKKVKESRIVQQASKRTDQSPTPKRKPLAPKLQCCGFRLYKRLQCSTISVISQYNSLLLWQVKSLKHFWFADNLFFR